MTRHELWIYDIEGGEKDNNEVTDIMLRDIGRRCEFHPPTYGVRTDPETGEFISNWVHYKIK